MKSKNIFITGINGFVGASLAQYELIKGNNVYGLIREYNKKSRHDILDRCTIIMGDILNSALISRILTDYEIDTVYHIAAQSIVRNAQANPTNCYASNIMGTVSVLEAVRLFRPSCKVVVASSDKAYGFNGGNEYLESDALRGDDTYATSKSCADLIAQTYFSNYGLNINITRCANVYGEGDMNTSRLIPNTILSILRGEKPRIYSGVLAFKREFIHISDVVRAYHFIAENGVPGEAYNVGCDIDRKVGDVVNMICELMKWDGGINTPEKKFKEIPAQCLSHKKLFSLGWTGEVCLSEGLQNTIEWYKK